MEEKGGKGRNAVGSECYDCLVHIRARFFGFVVLTGSQNFRSETIRDLSRKNGHLPNDRRLDLGGSLLSARVSGKSACREK